MIDLTSIDKEIERLERLKEVRRVLADPECLEIVKRQLAHESASRSTSADTLSGETDTQRGSLIGVVRRAVTTQTGTFMVADIGEAVRSMGLNLPNSDVGRMLQRLLKTGEIRVVKHSAGGPHPNTYERTSSAPQQQ